METVKSLTSDCADAQTDLALGSTNMANAHHIVSGTGLVTEVFNDSSRNFCFLISA